MNVIAMYARALACVYVCERARSKVVKLTQHYK